MSIRQHGAVNNQTITTAGNSGYLPNLLSNDDRAGNMTIFIDSGVVSGTTPSLIVTVYEALTAGGKLAQVYQFAPIIATQTGLIRQALQQILAPYVYIGWTISGTTPQFVGMTVNTLFS